MLVSLKAEERVGHVSVRSGTETELPDVNDFWIEIFNSENVRFKREKYADIAGKRIGMNSGDFTLKALHGDSLAVGFNKPFYMAKVPFTVEPQALVQVSAEAKLANVKLAVVYGDQIRQDYSGFYTVVTNMDRSGKSLKFTSTETRSGYIPYGKLSVVVYATIDGELKCYTLKDKDTGEPVYIDAKPNDFITLNVNTGISYGKLSFSIKIDNETEVVELEPVMVPADAVSNTRPSIVCSSVDEEGIYYVTEGVQDAPADLGFTYKAYAGIKKCELSVTSDYLRSLGVPEKVDVVTMDESVRTSLEALGFFFAETANIGVIGFEDVIYKYSKDSKYMGGGKPTLMGTLTLSLEDMSGYTASETIRIEVKPDAHASISVNNYDVWGWKIVNPVATAVKGNHTLMDAQFSEDGVVWNNCKTFTSATTALGVFEGLTPGKDYYFRVIYDDWIVISDVKTITTETPQQVGNAGFEDFQCTDFSYQIQAGGAATVKWYLPWTNQADAWWDVNSRRTLRTNPTTAYQEYKCYPTVSYIVSGVHGGSKAAQIASVGTGHTANEIQAISILSIYPGEIFIGKANDGHQDDWAYASTGHSFQNRPSALKFWYQYDSYENEKFYVKIEIRDASGAVIAQAEKTDGGAASLWTACSMPLTYSRTDVKAGAIFITFKSSTDSSPEVTKKKLTFYNSDNKNHYIGSVLRIDDIELTY